MKMIEQYVPALIILKKKDNDGLVIKAVIVYSLIDVLNVGYCKDVNKVEGWNLLDRSLLCYPGPVNLTLGFNAQKSIYAYLESLGIGHDLGSFIDKTAYDKAIKLRIRQLESILRFLTNNMV